MPKALCLKCGEIKNDAWGPCDECRSAPQSDDELAAALAVTEEHFGLSTLQSFGSLVKSGQRPKLSPETKEELLKLVQESKKRDQAPEQPFEKQPVLRFRPTGIQLFFSSLLSLVGLEFLVAAVAIGCTLARMLMELSAETESILLWSTIAAAVLGAVVLPLIAWKKPNAVPSYGWFVAGAYLSGFGAALVYALLTLLN